MGAKRPPAIFFIAGLLLSIVVSAGAMAQTSFYGKYRGTVTDINDPMALGRIKATVPAVFGATTSPKFP
jgi:hypothetical protein